PAALLAHRYGLRNCLVATIATTAAIEGARALIGARLPVAVLAFLSGFVFSLWAVIMAPIVAGTVDTGQRPAAFSIFCATMFATGIAGDWLGGRLPALMHGTRPVLLLSALIAAAALAPALRLRAVGQAPEGARIYPRIGFLLRFLIPFAVWHLGTGSF